MNSFRNLSSEQARSPHSPADRAHDVIAQQWPTLGRAIGRYQQSTAEEFTRMAYDAVDSGLIRHQERLRLAAEAENLGIRPFDAQLLIACAIRQWTLDRRYNALPSQEAPALSFEYQTWKRMAVRVALMISFVVILDGVILWKWLY